MALPFPTPALAPHAALDWTVKLLGAAVFTTTVGAALLAVAFLAPNRISLIGVGVVLFTAAGIELSAGFALEHHRGDGVAHFVGGAVCLAFLGFAFAVGVVYAGVRDPAPLALLLGTSCLCNAAFRALDLTCLKPEFVTTEGLDVAVTALGGTVAWANWPQATPAFVTLVGGLAVLGAGLSLITSARAASAAATKQGAARG